MNKSTETHFLAVGPQCWGRGLTRKDAVKNAAQNFPRYGYRDIKRPQDKHFSIYQSDSVIYCDGMGQVWTDSETLHKLQTSSLATND